MKCYSLGEIEGLESSWIEITAKSPEEREDIQGHAACVNHVRYKGVSDLPITPVPSIKFS